MRRKVLEFLLIIVLLSAGSGTGLCEDGGGLEAYGFLRADVGLGAMISGNSLREFSYVGRNNLRLELTNRDSAYGKLEGSVDFNVVSGKYFHLISRRTEGVTIGQDTMLIFDIRKLYLMTRFELFDLMVGRQLMRFGYGLVFSPINLFDRLDMTDINFSRVGADSVRLKFPFSDVGNFDLVLVPRTKIGESDVAGRVVFVLSDVEFGGIIGRFENEYLKGGLSFKGDLEIGLYGEFVYSHSKDRRFFESMVGADYSFFEDVYFGAEYYFNSLDVRRMDYGELLKLRNFPFVSRHYASFRLVYNFAVINHVILSLIKNLERRSFILFLACRRNVFQNTNIWIDLRILYDDISGFRRSTNGGFFLSTFGVDIRF